jgi:hypothetical protein
MFSSYCGYMNLNFSRFFTLSKTWIGKFLSKVHCKNRALWMNIEQCISKQYAFQKVLVT